MVQGNSEAAKCFAAAQEISPPFHRTRKMITAITSVRHLDTATSLYIQQSPKIDYPKNVKV